MIEYTRCNPQSKLAMCGHCYRYIAKPERETRYYDHYRLCDGGKYEQFLNVENFYAGNILECLRYVQVPEGKKETMVVQVKELDNTQVQQEPGIQDVLGR